MLGILDAYKPQEAVFLSDACRNEKISVILQK